VERVCSSSFKVKTLFRAKNSSNFINSHLMLVLNTTNNISCFQEKCQVGSAIKLDIFLKTTNAT
jgi:hypothetical protein